MIGTRKFNKLLQRCDMACLCKHIHIQGVLSLRQHDFNTKLKKNTSDFRNEFKGHKNVNTVHFTFQEKIISKGVFANDNI